LNQAASCPPASTICTLAEIRERFGAFQGTDRRLKLFARLEEFIAEATRSGIVRSRVVNGSFVTTEPAPNDIDLIVLVSGEHDVAREGSVEYRRWTEFFQQVRLEPGRQKGILKVAL